MRRRDLIAGAAWLATMSPDAAHPRAGSRRLAIFSPFEPAALMQEDSSNRYYRAFFAELRRLGRIEGESLTIERYGKEQNTASSADLAAEVVHNNPDAVYSIGPGTRLLKARTTTIPIVALMGDPIGQGLVESLARPGGNITGVSIDRAMRESW